MPSTPGTFRYYAEELDISEKTSRNWGKLKCEQEISKKYAKVQEACVEYMPKIQPFDQNSDPQHFIPQNLAQSNDVAEFQDSLSHHAHDATAIADKIKDFNLQTLIASAIYVRRYATGQLPKNEQNSARANFCLKVVRSFPLAAPNKNSHKKS